MPPTSEVRAIDAESARLQANAERGLRGVVRSAWPTLARAAVAGKLPDAMQTVIKRMQPILAEAMAVSHMAGYRRAQIIARKRKPKRVSLAADVAVDFLRRRLDMTAEQVDIIRDKYGRAAVSSLTDAAKIVTDRVDQAIAKSIEEGRHLGRTMDNVEEAFRQSGLNRVKPAMIETVARTDTQVAYSAGRQFHNELPEIDEFLWGYEYVTIGDDRVRNNHAALDGFRAKKNDPIWKRIMPPNGYNCRCTVIEIFDGDDEASTTKLRKGGEADDGWDFNPADVYKDLRDAI